MSEELAVLKRLYRERFGVEAQGVAPLRADGSKRRLYRLQGPQGPAVGVLNDDLKENRAFLEFSRHFRAKGLPVPEIYAEDARGEAYLEEDLGDTTLFQLLAKHRGPEGLRAPAAEAYRDTVRWLPKLQILGGQGMKDAWCYPRARFDRQSMLWDMNYFKYYFLRLGNIAFHEERLEEDFQVFAEHLLEADRSHFLYRDFQSRNVMVRDGKPWFIDYQGGRRGALQYDLASLLYDAKADLPFEFRDELLELYLREAAGLVPLDRADFLKHFPGFVLIRIMQAMGAYGLRGFHENKPLFLQSIPFAIRNLERLLIEHPLPFEAPELSAVLKRLVGSTALRQIGSAKLALTVRIQSFSFKNGMPRDDRGHGGGYVFDCRCLPNPGRLDEYKALSGLDAPVGAYLGKDAGVEKWTRSAYALIDQAVEDYGRRNFTDLFVAFGCTGGQHRSVWCAEGLARHLREQGVSVVVSHREQASWPASVGARP